MKLINTISCNTIEEPRCCSELCQAAIKSLKQTGLKSLRHIEVFEDNGQIILRGWAPTFHLKQVAQTLVMKTEGVHHLKNEIEVL
ncbi:MAG: BON domain-containing protein [Planctomycetaceae bacterium]